MCIEVVAESGTRTSTPLIGVTSGKLPNPSEGSVDRMEVPELRCVNGHRSVSDLLCWADQCLESVPIKYFLTNPPKFCYCKMRIPHQRDADSGWPDSLGL